MPHSQHQKATPDQVVHALKQAPEGEFIVWVGAGMSVTAGIPTSEGIVDRFLEKRWLQQEPPNEFGKPLLPSWEMPSGDTQKERQINVREWALQNVEEVRSWNSSHTGLLLPPSRRGAETPPRSDNWWMLYSVCLESIKGGSARQEFMYDITRHAKPNSAHILLANLMHRKLIRTVLTTNFDLLIKMSLSKFSEYPAELGPESIRQLAVDAPFAQVAYLHGPWESYRQRHTGPETKQIIAGLEGFLQQSFLRRGLIVVGYRGGDETPMDVLVKVIADNGRGPGRGLFWVTPETTTAGLTVRVQTLLDFEDTYYVPGLLADQFFEAITIPTAGPPTDYQGDLPLQLQESAPQLVAEASTSLSLGRFNDSINCCRRALQWNPLYGPAYLVWGNALYFQHNLDSAIEKYRQAINTVPPLAQAFLNWGKILAQRGAHDEAIEKYESAAELRPEDPYIFHHWCNSLKALGYMKKAREKCARASLLSPRASVGRRLL